jgi:hypothetical protein
MLRRHLSLARALEQAHARLPRRDRADDRIGSIRRTVGGDDNLEPIGRVVELEQVLETPTDDRLLVVR